MSGSKAANPAFSLTIVLILALLVTACSREDAVELSQTADAETVQEQEKTPDRKVEAEEPPMGGEWRLIAIDRRELSSGGTPTVVFSKKGECWGSTGVNDFRTTFTLEGLKYGRLKMGSAAVTRKAGPPEAMALERLFLERLEQAKSYEVKGDLLYLHSGENQNLTLERVYQ